MVVADDSHLILNYELICLLSRSYKFKFLTHNSKYFAKHFFRKIHNILSFVYIFQKLKALLTSNFSLFFSISNLSLFFNFSNHTSTIMSNKDQRQLCSENFPNHRTHILNNSEELFDKMWQIHQTFHDHPIADTVIVCNRCQIRLSKWLLQGNSATSLSSATSL